MEASVTFGGHGGFTLIASGSIASEHVSVLLVEDSQDFREVLAELLCENGYAVRVAGTAEQALDLAVQQAPHFVLLDLGLPDMDGTVVAKALRQRYGPDLVIVALTGRRADMVYADKGSGIDHVLTKPFDPNRLYALLPPL